MSITKKLLIINALICVAFLAILATVYFSFRNIEDALSGTFATETRRIADNSDMTRNLSRVLSDLELVLRTFYERNDIVENDGARLVSSIEAILEYSRNQELHGLAAEFGKRIEAVLAQCEQVNAIRREIRALEKAFETRAESLDNVVAQGLVEAIVQGSDTSDMEQLSSLVGGYRESFMRVELRFERLGPEYFKRPVEKNGHPLLALLRDLHLRLRTLTASAPKIAKHGQELMSLVREYEKMVPELHAASAKLESVLEKLAVEREVLLSAMEESDRQVAVKTEETTRSLTALIERTLGLNLLICLLALPLVVSGSVAAFSIKRPVQKVVESVERLARGEIPGPIEGKYPGEFAGLCANIDMLVETTRRVTRIAEEVAAGHVRHTVVERSENDRLIRALNTMIRSLGKLQRETDGMIRAVNQGRLDIQGKAKTFRGGWRDLVLGVNQLIAGLSAAVFKTASLEREMALARRIQTSLLPAASNDIHPELEIAAAMLPAKQVGGDFYDWVSDRSGSLWISIGDVSGHGLTSGLIMMMAQTIHAHRDLEHGLRCGRRSGQNQRGIVQERPPEAWRNPFHDVHRAQISRTRKIPVRRRAPYHARLQAKNRRLRGHRDAGSLLEFETGHCQSNEERRIRFGSRRRSRPVHRRRDRGAKRAGRNARSGRVRLHRGKACAYGPGRYERFHYGGGGRVVRRKASRRHVAGHREKKRGGKCLKDPR